MIPLRRYAYAGCRGYWNQLDCTLASHESRVLQLERCVVPLMLSKSPPNATVPCFRLQGKFAWGRAECAGGGFMSVQGIKTLCLVVLASVSLQPVAWAQNPTGKLKMSVTPKQAYTFVDGKAIGPGNRTIRVDVGTHHVVVANYGYKFVEQDVSIESDQTVPMNIKLEAVGERVPGPRGRIQIEAGWGAPTDAAVLLNGKKPLYFVGHVDEFDNDFFVWRQELIVPPGTHQVTVTRFGKELWSGPITVAEDQRVIVYIKNGREKTRNWARGSECRKSCIPGDLSENAQRFRSGIASATVVVAPVSASVSANPPK